MTAISKGLDNSGPSVERSTEAFNPSFIQTSFADNSGFEAATAAASRESAETYYGKLVIVDNQKDAPATGFLSSLRNAIVNLGNGATYSDAGVLPSTSTPSERVPITGSGSNSVDAPPTTAPEARPDVPPAVRSEVDDRLHDKGFNDNGGKHPGEAPSEGSTLRPGQEHLNPLLKGVLDGIGKKPQELEPGINPRLGCVRLVSHAMHEVDPTFPETNNTAEFRRALKQHGYEAITLKPGDPAVGKSHPGDIIVGSRPDGMPSHVAINMGDGSVFNNNSDNGQGQIDKLDQFQQGMHDKTGKWNKDGFTEVQIYRKRVS